MELPQEVIEKIMSFIPGDKDLKSPTSDCIRHLVLYDIHLVNFQRFPHMSFIQHAFMAIKKMFGLYTQCNFSYDSQIIT